MSPGLAPLFRRSVVVLYWLTLPVCILMLIVGLFAQNEAGEQKIVWPLVAGSILMIAVLGWRLRLNHRALGHTGDTPPVHRLAFVFVPLALLALVGLLLVTVGTFWIGLGVWLLIDPGVLSRGPAAYPVAAVPLLVVGPMAAGGGILLCIPFLRLFRPGTPEPSSPDESGDLEGSHD